MPTRSLVTRYKDDLALFPDMWHKVGLVLISAFLLWFPFAASSQWLYTANMAFIAIVGSVSLMVLTGFAGQISLGHAAFLAIGAYSMSAMSHEWGLPFWLIFPLAGLLSAAIGLAIGVFALRLKGLYLAIVTIGLLYIVRHVLLVTKSISGGTQGITVPVYAWFGEGSYPVSAAATVSPRLLESEFLPDMHEMMDYGPITLNFDKKLYFIFLIVAILVAWFAKNLSRSNAGRQMMAVRDHDIAAATLGVNPSRAKILAFGISSFLAGIAGAMFAMQHKMLTVETFSLNMSIQYVAMIVVGGVGTVFGGVAGAVFFWVVHKFAELAGPSLPLVSKLSSTDQQATVLFSLVVCVFLILEPLGLLGIWLRIKRYFMAWPFRY